MSIYTGISYRELIKKQFKWASDYFFKKRKTPAEFKEIDIFVSAYSAPFGNKHTRYSAGLSERIKVTQKITIEADYSYNKDYDYKWHEISVKINYYY